MSAPHETIVDVIEAALRDPARPGLRHREVAEHLAGALARNGYGHDELAEQVRRAARDIRSRAVPVRPDNTDEQRAVGNALRRAADRVLATLEVNR